MKYKKNKKIIHKLEKIDENKIFVEINNKKYNEYNQISIIEKINEIYNKIVIYLLKINNL
jgi:hypothetical protein